MDLCPKLEATTRVGCTSLHPPLVLFGSNVGSPRLIHLISSTPYGYPIGSLSTDELHTRHRSDAKAWERFNNGCRLFMQRGDNSAASVADHMSQPVISPLLLAAARAVCWRRVWNPSRVSEARPSRDLGT
ncbi:hypothetical protein VTN96DRAFT_9960 [Rasamsonia emersonii]